MNTLKIQANETTTDLLIKEYKQQRVVTFKDIDELHQRPEGTAGRNFRENRENFIEGADYFSLSGKSLEKFAATNSVGTKVRTLILVTQTGYPMLTKSMNDSLSWAVQRQLVNSYFGKTNAKVADATTITPELEIKRQNAEARLKNANSRQAALLNKIAESVCSDVNKAILQSKATEVLTGEKLLEMPVVGNKYFDSNEIAKKLGVFSKSGKPHQTAISQFIKNEIDVLDNEKEEFAGEKNGWSGSVTKYTQSVIDKVELALEDMGYPNVIQSGGKRYSVVYQ